MAVTFRSAASASPTAAATFITVAKPAGVTTGDLLLAYFYSETPNAVFSQGSGDNFNVLGSDYNANVGTQVVLYKIATASEPSSYTFYVNSSQYINAGILAYYNNSPGGSLAIDTFILDNTAGSVASYAPPTVNTATPNEVVVSLFAALGLTSWTLPATQRFSSLPGSGDDYADIGASDYVQSSQGATSAQTTSAGGGTSYWLGATVAIKAPPPFAPTLSTPANASYTDLQNNGGPFSWVYNTGGATSGETYYDYREKVSGGAYSYWNASTGAMQTTDVPNASTATSITFPVNTFTDGNTYNWSVASTDANGAGPYASDFTVTAQLPPTVSVTSPTGTLTTAQTPTVTWADTLAPGGTQANYRVVTYSAEQYSAVGFAPGSGASLDDSGVVSGSSLSYTVTKPLPNNTTCRSYVQITQSPGGQTSAWTYTAFTVSLDSPATSTVVSTVATYPGTTLPANAVTVHGYDDWMTANQSNAIGGNTTGWAAGANTTLGVTTTNPQDGSYAFALTAAAAGNVTMTTPTGTGAFPVTPGQITDAIATFRAPATARSCQVQINWYQASGAASAVKASTVSSTVTDTTTGYTVVALNDTAPSDAAFASIAPTVLGVAAGEVVQVGTVFLGPGTGNLVYDSNLANAIAAVGPTWTVTAAPIGTANGDLNVLNGGTNLAEWVYYGTGAASAYAYMQSQIINVVPGATYTLSALIDGTSVTAGGPGIQLWDPTLTTLYLGANQTPGTKGTVSGMWTAPAGVTQVRVLANTNQSAVTAGALLTWSQIQLTETASVGTYAPGPLWTRGGLVGSTTVALLRSDGLYVRGASPANPTPLPHPSQTVTIYDAECVPGVSYTYTAVVSAVLGANATIASPSSGPSGNVSTTPSQAWLFNPGSPSGALPALIASKPASSRATSVGTFALLGNPTVAITADVFQGRTGNLVLVTRDEETAQAVADMVTVPEAVSILVRPPAAGASVGSVLYFTVTGTVTEGKAAEAGGGGGTAMLNTAQRMVGVPYAEQSRPAV